DILRFLNDAKKKLSNPEQPVEKQIDQIEKENDGPGGTPNTRDWAHPAVRQENMLATPESSQVPGVGDSGVRPNVLNQKYASSYTYDRRASAIPDYTLDPTPTKVDDFGLGV